MERLFFPFSRGEVRPSQQGLGLGLYIASEIAKAHGGTLDVISTPPVDMFYSEDAAAALRDRRHDAWANKVCEDDGVEPSKGRHLTMAWTAQIVLALSKKV
jgi:signal transduction histidine kinase